jgi:cyclic pyranopterin phosphate synthase
MGVNQIRLTGGEPLVRRDVTHLIEMLSKIPGLKSLSLTTNGVLLKEMARDLAQAGLTRINVSCDSLTRNKFHKLTRRDDLHRVLEGLEELEKYPSISPIKVNAVAMRGFTEEEVVPFALLARRKPYIIRFIEFMPLDADQLWDRNMVLTGDEMKEIVEREVGPLVQIPGEDPAETATRYRFADGNGELGFINPVSHPFCKDCDRIRITAEGKMLTCLFGHIETDLREFLRNGSSDEVLEEVVRRATLKKEMKHYINDGEAFKRTKRNMSQIGG